MLGVFSWRLFGQSLAAVDAQQRHQEVTHRRQAWPVRFAELRVYGLVFE